jgi:hypothetical protein
VIEYAVYKGEEILVIGTAKECAEKLQVKIQTIRFYASPVHLKRVEKSKDPEERMIAVKIDDKDENENDQ